MILDLFKKTLSILWHLFVIATAVTTSLLMLNSCSEVPEKLNSRGSSDHHAADLAPCQKEASVPSLTTCDAKQGESEKNSSDDSDQNIEKVSLGKILGVVKDEKSDLRDFEGLSVFATHDPQRGLNISIANTEVYDFAFKKIKSWECRQCQGDSDPNCQMTETKASVLNILFTIPFAEDSEHLVSSEGWPKANENSNEPESGSYAKQNGLSFFWSGDVTTGFTGTAKFKDSKRPGKSGDAFELELKINSETLAYQATISGQVHNVIDNPKPPENCKNENGKYALPILEQPQEIKLSQSSR